MFENIEMLPADAILGLTEAFKNDANPDKVNLGVGIYKNADGVTPIFEADKKAEKILQEKLASKTYLPIPGSNEYGKVVQELLFGPSSSIIEQGRAVTAQSPGGTGALRIAGEVLKKILPEAKLWISDPTWANHTGIFGNAGLEIEKYRYYNPDSKTLDFDGMLESLSKASKGDIVLLHGCCHNPTGIDPAPEQWKKIAELVKKLQILPVVDFAYQGLAKGIEEDAAGLRTLCGICDEVVVASSFSKNFGLYNERTGAVTFLCDSADAAARIFSHIKLVIRRCYSNPPAHGSAIVTTIMSDPQLRGLWEDEVKAMRDRIHQMRELFVKTLKQKGAKGDFSFITKQNGMFSFSGLTKEQVQKLREKYSIYIVGSGRINVAGMTADNMDRICEAIAAVL